MTNTPISIRWSFVVVAIFDATAAVFCLWAALSLRYGAIQSVGAYTTTLLASPLILIALAARMNLYGRRPQYSGGGIFYRTLGVATAHCVILAGYAAIARPGELPREALVINLPLLGCALAISRLVIGDRLYRASKPKPLTRALIYGAGEAGIQLAAALHHTSSTKVVGFLDDNHALWGQRLLGHKIYPPQKAGDLVLSEQVNEVLLAMPSAGRTRLGIVAKELSSLSVKIRTLPGLEELAGGQVTISDVHEVQIEDILGRDPVAPDRTLLERPIKGHCVLITGAGGSIGSALCREISRLNPKRLVMLDNSEFALYAIDSELNRLAPEVERIAILGSTTDEALLQKVMKEQSIEVVLHAAAYKHVPLVEFNPCEGAYNNVVGTWRAAQAAAQSNAKLFVLISTDKAVRPTNVMGASKRLAEMIVQSIQVSHPDTVFCMVRFGNVLGSSGSVVPLFKEQISCGGPITVTHPDVTRFFMTIPEAAQLVLQASAMAEGGDVFILDMGEPVKIVDLARRMIELSGFAVKEKSNPGGDIEIKFTGLRPGEKLYEELLVDNNASTTDHPRVMRARDLPPDQSRIYEAVLALEKMKQASRNKDVILLLERMVSDYQRDRRVNEFD